MDTAERILNFVDDVRVRMMPEKARASGLRKTLAVLGIIGSTAAVGYGLYRAVVAHQSDQRELNLD
ncbi:MAG: hypothetical protein ACKVQS_04720 [Fimbriimonadaceae bacterium]